MCFSSPKAPAPPPIPEPDPAIAEQQAAAKADASAIKAQDKEKRLQDAISKGSGVYGMRSLISGSRGGGGFGRGLMS
jgi:hypothetical protein